MRKVLQASVLVIALAFSAYAGDMQNGITSEPPQETVTGDMQNGVTATPEQPTTTEILINLLVSLIP